MSPTRSSINTFPFSNQSPKIDISFSEVEFDVVWTSCWIAGARRGTSMMEEFTNCVFVFDDAIEVISREMAAQLGHRPYAHQISVNPTSKTKFNEQNEINEIDDSPGTISTS
jgi:hypothetical protein